MRYYVVTLLAEAFYCLLKWSKGYLVLASIDIYIYSCSSSLYVECKTSFPEDGVNITENTVIRSEHDESAPQPPPPYESCIDMPAE